MTPETSPTQGEHAQPALLPCPFCGAAAHFESDSDGWNWVECESCGMQGNRSASVMEDCKPKLREAWNTRAGVHPDVASGYAKGWEDGMSEATALLAQSAKTEHVPAVVSTNGAESNMTGGAYAELPAAGFHCKSEHGAVVYIHDVAYQDGPVTPIYNETQMRAFADATHALRVAASHGQAPAGAALSIKDANWVRDGIADFLADNWPEKKYTLEQIEAGVRAIEITPSAVRSMPTAQAAPATESYVQPVPDKCDRITWRGNYYHLPLAPAADAFAGPQPVTDVDVRNMANRVISGQAEEDELLEFFKRLVPPTPVHVAAAPTPAAQADSEPMLIDWTTPDDPVQALDNIMAVYEKCMGTTPGPEMARIVRKTKEMLFDWWGLYRESARDAMAQAADSGVQEDAARWRMLPAFYEEYQIDAMKLCRDIDAALAAKGGA